jgi:hypothetical protein
MSVGKSDFFSISKRAQVRVPLFPKKKFRVRAAHFAGVLGTTLHFEDVFYLYVDKFPYLIWPILFSLFGGVCCCIPKQTFVICWRQIRFCWCVGHNIALWGCVLLVRRQISLLNLTHSVSYLSVPFVLGINTSACIMFRERSCGDTNARAKNASLEADRHRVDRVIWGVS